MRRRLAAAALAGWGCNPLFEVDQLTFEQAASSAGATSGGSGGPQASGGGPAASTGAGAGGEGGSSSDCPVVAGEHHYVLSRIDAAALTVDGSCDEPTWTLAPAVPFEGGDTSDNSLSCRMVWRQADAVVYGCCEIGDGRLDAVTTRHDGAAIFLDDSIEYYLSNDIAVDGTGLRPKLQLNALGTVTDADYSSGSKDVTFETNATVALLLGGTVNDDSADQGWSVEWKADIGYAPVLDQVVLCDVLMNDDDAGTRTLKVAVGPGTPQSFNDPSTWGTCRFACSLAE